MEICVNFNRSPLKIYKRPPAILWQSLGWTTITFVQYWSAFSFRSADFPIWAGGSVSHLCWSHAAVSFYHLSLSSLDLLKVLFISEVVGSIRARCWELLGCITQPSQKSCAMFVRPVPMSPSWEAGVGVGGSWPGELDAVSMSVRSKDV